MAKRSDFAQKLLDDLRLRKEKMGFAPSGESLQKPPSAATAHGTSRCSFQVFGEVTSSKSSSRRTSKTDVAEMWLSTGHHTTPSLKGASQDIVPIGRTKSHERGIDMSMALALALSNSGKLQNIEIFTNTAMGKKLILHRGSLSFRETGGNMLKPSIDQFPFLSPLQIGEISKGVQNINMILKACSNGLNFSRDSIDIGRELLKGAMDLEDSLRMLVTLQDASDYMVGSKGKQTRLLEGKEEEEESNDLNNRKFTNRPRFSFDGSSRHSKKPAIEGKSADTIEYKQMALSHPEKLKASKSNCDKGTSNSSLKLNSHRRSLSCGAGPKPDAQSQKQESKMSQSQECENYKKDGNSSTLTKNKQLGPIGSSTREKVRIPNVIAKLMGLEELPLTTAEVNKSDRQKDPDSKQVKGTAKTITLDVEINMKEADEMTYMVPKMTGKNKIVQERSNAEVMALNNFQTVYIKEKKSLQEQNHSQNMNAASNYSPGVHCNISKHLNANNTDQSREARQPARKEAGETEEKAYKKQQLCKGTIEQHVIRKSVLDHKTKHPRLVPHEYHEDAGGKKKDIIPREQINTKVNVQAPEQLSVVQGMKSKTAVQKSAKDMEYNAKNKVKPTIEKTSDMQSRNKEKSSNDIRVQKLSTITSVGVGNKGSSTDITHTDQAKEHLKHSHQEKQRLSNRSSAYHGMDMKSGNGHSEERSMETVTKTDKEKAMPLVLPPAIRKPLNNLSAQKVEDTEVISDRNVNNKILVEEPIKDKTSDEKGQNLKQQTSFLHELEHRWKERTGKPGVSVSSHVKGLKHHSQHKVDKAGVIVSSVTMSMKHHSERKTDLPILTCNSLTDDPKKLVITDQIIVAETDVEFKQSNIENPMQDHGTTFTISKDLQIPDVSLKEGLELQPISKENQAEGLASRRTHGIYISLGLQNQATSQFNGQVMLTENEHALKQILIKSQHFLNTAQALFKIRIPVGVLQASENVCQDKVSKTLFDCGYELMRRKGKREETLFSSKIPSAPSKVRCLDVLIKELNDDLKSLEFPNKIEGNDYDIAGYLHKMIEKDVQNRKPDANCMWDFGWNSMIFANTGKAEIIRDVEKYLLNGLINDLARDLMNVSIITS